MKYLTGLLRLVFVTLAIAGVWFLILLAYAMLIDWLF